MARSVCVSPCPPSAALSVYLPFMGDMSAQGSLSLEGGCAGCDVVSNLLIQLGPALGAMGIPMCILGCVGAIVSVVTELGSAITSVPPLADIADLAEAIAAVPEKCACVVGFALPPPAGTVCEMLKTVLGVIQVANQALVCVIGLMGDIINISFRISGLELSAVPESRIAAQCVSAQAQAMTDALVNKFGSVIGLIGLLQPVIDFVAAPIQAMPGGDDFAAALTALSTALQGFTAGVPVGTPPTAVFDAMRTLQSALADVLSVLEPIVSICP